MVVPWEQQHPSDEDAEITCLLDDDCWQPLQLGDFALPHLYLGAFSIYALLVSLEELLTGTDKSANPVKGYGLVFRGLFSALIFTLFNFYIFTVLALKNDFEIDWELAEKRKWMAYVLLGYGAVTSYFFIVCCLFKYFGISVSSYSYS